MQSQFVQSQSHENLQPEENQLHQSSEIQREISPLPSETEDNAGTGFLRPSQSHQTVLTLSSGSLTTFAQPSAPSAASGGKDMRCAVCVKALCSRRHRCAGKGKRSLCQCSHPRLGPNERVRGLTEERIQRLLAERGG
jgi:hypothetical protein